MSKSYEPNKREIFSEMFKGMGLYLQQNILRKEKPLKNSGLRGEEEFGEFYGQLFDIDSPIKQFGLRFGQLFSTFALFPYVVPTAARIYREQKVFTIDDYGVLGGSFGIAGGVAVDLYSVLAYYDFASHGHPEVFLLPVATNAISGVYETGRKLYRDSRKRLIKRHSNGV